MIHLRRKKKKPKEKKSGRHQVSAGSGAGQPTELMGPASQKNLVAKGEERHKQVPERKR